MDAETKAKAKGSTPQPELRVCPKCQQQRLTRKGTVAVLPLGKYRCQSCKAEMVRPLRFHGKNRARYVFSVLLLGSLFGGLVYGISGLLASVPDDNPELTKGLEYQPQRARYERLSEPVPEVSEDLGAPELLAIPDELQITPALESQVMFPTAPSPPTTLPSSGATMPGAEPSGGAFTESELRTGLLPMPSIKARPDPEDSEEPAVEPPPAPKSAAKLITPAPSAPVATDKTPTAPAPPESSKAPAPPDAAAKSPPATPLAAPSAKAKPPAEAAPAADADAPAKPPTAPKADITLNSFNVSTQGQMTRITLKTSTPSDAIRLSENSAQNAYMVDFPGKWAIAPGVSRLLRPSDAKLIRVEVKQAEKYLRVTLYCVPEVINQPLVVASAEGFTITVQ